MRFVPLLAASLAAGTLADPVAAQRERDDRRDPETRIYRAPGPFAFGLTDSPRAVLGISTGASGSARDTLGVLVTSVTSNGPAERAGIEEGNRIQAINNVNLRVSAADASDPEMGHLMSRRLTRELNRIRPGDEVELRVYSAGRTRALRVRTADADSLYGRRRRARAEADDRATLGINLGSTGSIRDTLGVLVIGVNDSGPAARAGIIEGNRIAEINGVNLRLAREDVGDDWVANTRVQRLTREIRRLEPGAEVTLRVWQDGQFRTVRLRTVRASDLPRRRGGLFISGDHMGVVIPPLPPVPVIAPEQFEWIGPEVRRTIERALDGAGRALDEAGRAAGRTLRHLDIDGGFEGVDLDHDFDVDYENGVRVRRPRPAVEPAPQPAPKPAPRRAAPTARVTSLMRV